MKMKKLNLKTVLTTLLAALMLLALCACGGGKTDPLAEHAGYYLAVEIDGGENSASREDMEQLKELGMYVTLTLNEDGTGEMGMFGVSTSLTWDTDGFDAGEDGTGDFVFEGNTVRASEPGADETIIFEKVDALPEN